MNIEEKTIICGGFTPCVQRILEFDLVEKESVNRAARVTIGIGGKGANTARMVRQLGGTPLLVGFVGGANGRLLEDMLRQEDVEFRNVEVSGETRICQTLVEQGNPETTELVEEMPALIDDEWHRMMDLFGELDLNGAVVPVSGKLPAGAPEDAYAQIAALVAQMGGQLIIDAPGDPLMRTLEQRPFIVKINDVELLQTVGGDGLIGGCRSILERGAQSVLVTRGSRSAFYMDASQSFELVPPRIDAINPVGSGDAVTAGIAVALAQELPLKEMLLQGMACGAANALNLKSGFLKSDDVKKLMMQVEIKALCE